MTVNPLVRRRLPPVSVVLWVPDDRKVISLRFRFASTVTNALCVVLEKLAVSAFVVELVEPGAVAGVFQFVFVAQVLEAPSFHVGVIALEKEDELTIASPKMANRVRGLLRKRPFEGRRDSESLLCRTLGGIEFITALK